MIKNKNFKLISNNFYFFNYLIFFKKARETRILSFENFKDSKTCNIML